VLGGHHPNGSVGSVHDPTDVHAQHMLSALVLQPFSHFKIAQGGHLLPAGEVHRICQVVLVTVRNQNIGWETILGRASRLYGSAKKRVEQQGRLPGTKFNTGVSVKYDVDRRIHETKDTFTAV
jgi:hypothetical protein